jgi:hypothetical protein
MTSGLDEELPNTVFKDKRLVTRVKKIIKALATGCGQSIPQVCEEWAKAIATYRFFVQ